MKSRIQNEKQILNDPSNPLTYFEPFIDACGYTYPEVAKTLGITRQATLHWRAINDVKISFIYRFAELMGYTFTISLIPIDKDYGSSDSGCDEKQCYADIKDFDENMSLRRLFFLKAAMRRDGISVADLAKADNVTYSAIVRMFNMDDMAFSKIIRYAEHFGWNIHCKYTPKNKEQIHVPKKRGVCSVEIFKEFE